MLLDVSILNSKRNLIVKKGCFCIVFDALYLVVRVANNFIEGREREREVEKQQKLRVVLGQGDCFTSLISKVYRCLVVEDIAQVGNVITVSFKGGDISYCLKAIAAFISRGEIEKAHLIE